MIEQRCRQGVLTTEKRDYERKLVGGVKNRVNETLKRRDGEEQTKESERGTPSPLNTFELAVQRGDGQFWLSWVPK